MTVQLNLPPELERQLLDEVRQGRHASLEAVILEKLSHLDNPDIAALLGVSPEELRNDLDRAWTDRNGKVDGDTAFAKIRSQGSNR